MAGKLHKTYDNYALSTGRQVVPGDRRGRAYAEGYQARRKGAIRASNPHPTLNDNAITSAYGAWDMGWIDADTFKPATHVGLPNNIV